MTCPLTPQGPKGWLATVLALVERGGPVTLLITLILGAVSIYGLVGEVRRVQAMNVKLYERLLVEQQAQLALALQCQQLPPRP